MKLSNCSFILCVIVMMHVVPQALFAGAYLSSFSRRFSKQNSLSESSDFNFSWLRAKKSPASLMQADSKHLEMLSPLEKIREAQKPFTQTKRVVLTTKDGLMRYGVLTLRPAAKGNIVLCHGAACDKEYMEPFVVDLFKEYNCLAFDFRRHGEVCDGQYSTIGKKEAYEVEAAVAIFKNEPGCMHLPMFGFGISMGGAALLEAQSKNNGLFDALIIQSTFESLHRQAQRTFFLYRLPLFNLLIYAEPSRFFARKQYGVHVFKITPARAIKAVKVPIFLIHGKRDKVIGFDAFKKLKRAGKSIIKTWTPDSDKHVYLYRELPELFTKYCNEFLHEVLGRIKNMT